MGNRRRVDCSRQLSTKIDDNAVSMNRSNDIWRRRNRPAQTKILHIDSNSDRSRGQCSYSKILDTSSDEQSSCSRVEMKLFIELSLLTRGLDLHDAISHYYNCHDKILAANTGAKLTYGVQNINATTAQYAKGFPFVKGQNPSSKVFTLTLCPPHDLESVSQNFVENLSFDLGFTVLKSEKRNAAFVASVAKNSPAAIAGVLPTDIIKFAFAHTLTSPFRKPIPKFGSVSLLTCDSSDSSPAIAVYHAPEVETIEAAAYAMKCIDAGSEISFDCFRRLFPFDVSVPLRAYSPASFNSDEDPILYPVTVVFERSSSDDDFLPFDEVTEHADQALSQVLTFFGRFPCVNGR